MGRRTVLGICVAAGVLALVGGSVLEISGVGAGTRYVRVTVPAGLRVVHLGSVLAQAGAIRSSAIFQAWAVLSGRARDRVPAGRYFVTRPTPYAELVDEIVSQRRRLTRVVIPEGWVIPQIAQLLRDSVGIPAESTLVATQDSVLRARLRTPARDAEGYLFPATYEFFPNQTTARAAVDSMVRAFERRWKSAWTEQLQRDGRTRHAVVTLASIVEREAARPAERPLIAAVYSNRLRDGERLQADPTVLYALGVVAKRVTYEDLKFASPYNTYRNAGLPPGPIGAPGTASLAAAVTPADVPFKFFVAFPDGHHEFRTTYAEHLDAVQSARAARGDSSGR